VKLAQQAAVGVEAVKSVVGGGPDPTGVVEPDPVKRPRVAGGEDLAAAEAAPVDGEAPDVLLSCVDDVQPGLVGGECEAVRADEVLGHDGRVARGGIEAVDVAGADLADGLVLTQLRGRRCQRATIQPCRRPEQLTAGRPSAG
jgi:hypothetical protein